MSKVFKTLQLTSHKDYKNISESNYEYRLIVGANPSSISMSLSDSSVDQDKKGDNASTNRTMAIHEKVSFKFYLDGTGVIYDDELSIVQQASILKHLCFQKITKQEDGKTITIKPFIKISWGETFTKGLTKDSYVVQADSLSINYTLFSREGNPLRAEVNFTGTLKMESIEDGDEKTNHLKSTFFNDLDSSLDNMFFNVGEKFQGLRQKMRVDKFNPPRF